VRLKNGLQRTVRQPKKNSPTWPAGSRRCWCFRHSQRRWPSGEESPAYDRTGSGFRAAY